MLNNYFYLSRREERALIILFAIFLILILLVEFYPAGKTSSSELDFDRIISIVDSIEQSRIAPNTSQASLRKIAFRIDTVGADWLICRKMPKRAAYGIERYQQKGGKILNKSDLEKIYGINDSIIQVWGAYIRYPQPVRAKKKRTKQTLLNPTPFKIDTVSEKWLVRRGFPRYTAANLIKYRSRGKTFHQANDLTSIYGFNDSLLLAWTPYIIFPEKTPENTKKPIQCNLNTANAVQLDSIPEIGMKTAEKIIKYRTLLGGFYHHKQLKEVYGLNKKQLKSISRCSYIYSSDLKLLPINKSSLSDLKRHPYISFYQARAILNYRFNGGIIKTPEDLLVIPGLDTLNLSKTINYLDFSPD